MNKYTKYEELKAQLETAHYEITAYKEINYGIQFDVIHATGSAKIRIYESKKKGVSVDLSLVKDTALKAVLGSLSRNEIQQSEAVVAGNQTDVHQTKVHHTQVCNTQTDKIATTQQEVKTGYQSDVWHTPLIGVDESGKGDYFGPLVIAGVYADEVMKNELQMMGVMDSKKIQDTKISELAKRIQAICPYKILLLNNKTYNKLYADIQNLNYLLAWGHSEVIKELWEKTNAACALSDQFGPEHLIIDQLKNKKVTLTFEQRPRGEENVVVAAASILARAYFVEHIKNMEAHWQQVFPKGASYATVMAAKTFVKVHGREQIDQVAKVHFKTTQSL